MTGCGLRISMEHSRSISTATMHSMMNAQSALLRGLPRIRGRWGTSKPNRRLQVQSSRSSIHLDALPGQRVRVLLAQNLVSFSEKCMHTGLRYRCHSCCLVLIRILNSHRNFVRTDAKAEFGALVSEVAHTRGNLACLFPSNFIPLCTFTVCIGTPCLGSARLDLLSLTVTISGSLRSSCISYRFPCDPKFCATFRMANSHHRFDYTLSVHNRTADVRLIPYISD